MFLILNTCDEKMINIEYTIFDLTQSIFLFFRILNLSSFILQEYMVQVASSMKVLTSSLDCICLQTSFSLNEERWPMKSIAY
jgi:hypothetical protein